MPAEGPGKAAHGRRAPQARLLQEQGQGQEISSTGWSCHLVSHLRQIFCYMVDIIYNVYKVIY